MSHGSKCANKYKKLRKIRKILTRCSSNACSSLIGMEGLNFNYEEVQAYMQAEIAAGERLLKEMAAVISDNEDPVTAPVDNGNTHESDSDHQESPENSDRNSEESSNEGASICRNVGLRISPLSGADSASGSHPKLTIKIPSKVANCRKRKDLAAWGNADCYVPIQCQGRKDAISSTPVQGHRFHRSLPRKCSAISPEDCTTVLARLVQKYKLIGRVMCEHVVHPSLARGIVPFSSCPLKHLV